MFLLCTIMWSFKAQRHNNTPFILRLDTDKRDTRNGGAVSHEAKMLR